MARDLFKKPFDEATQSKLTIFREYLKEWLPTFTKRKEIFWKDIIVYDFFAGEGLDKNANYGSPLIILKELESHHQAIIDNELSLRVVLNEKSEAKFKKLSKNIEKYKEQAPYTITAANRDFQELFAEVYPKMLKNKQLPRFIFLDQNGVKQVTENVFNKLIALKRTDFMFFISSSFVRRFNELPEFSEYIKITKSEFDQSRPYHSHRVVYNYYKSLIKKNNDYYLAPFSIKKGSNIYGLIFGSNHLLGIEKFLRVAWKINENSGDANFNIDEESHLDTTQMSLFGNEPPKKLSLFQNELKSKILSKELVNTVDVYKFTFENGCLPKHANSTLRELIKSNSIGEVKMVTQDIHRLEPQRIKLVK